MYEISYKVCAGEDVMDYLAITWTGWFVSACLYGGGHEKSADWLQPYWAIALCNHGAALGAGAMARRCELC